MPRDYSTNRSRPVRSPEAVALFNAPLGAELILNACWAKAQQGSPGLRWAEAFLVLPIALHPATRQTLPRDSRITLTRWAVRNPDVLADMQHRVAMMADPTKRAIRHGLRVDRLRFADAQLYAPQAPKNPQASWPEELRDAVRAARTCGQWLSVTETHLAFEMLGIEE